MICRCLTWRRASSSACLPPSRSCTEAGVITKAHSSPKVSTTKCRLRPTIFFPPVVAFRPALLGGLHALAVEDRGGGLRLFAGLASDPLPQGIMNPLPGAVLLPQAKVMKHNTVRWQVMRQRPPGAAIATLIKNGV